MIGRRDFVLGSGAVLAGGSGSWADEAYPSKPIKIVVPFVAGGSADNLARRVAEIVSKDAGVPVVIDNKGGASGIIAAESVRGASKDGYTLLLAHTTLMTIFPLARSDLSYDPARDFQPLTLLAKTPQVLVSHPSRFKGFTEYLQAAKEHPGAVTYATGGIATPPHLTGELFNLQAKVKVTHVPFNGAPAAITAVLGRHVDSAYANIDVLVERLRGGQLAGLAVAADQRSPLLPNIPTFKELGVRDVVNNTWFGLVAPTGTPAPVLARLSRLVTAAAESAEFQSFLQKNAADRVDGGPKAFAQLLTSEHTRWGAVVKAAGSQSFKA